MKIQYLLLAAFGFMGLISVNGCVVHEHGHDWHHSHSHTVIVEPAHHDHHY